MKPFKCYIIIICVPVLIFSSCKIGREFSRVEQADMPAHFQGGKENQQPELSVEDIGWSTLYEDTRCSNEYVFIVFQCPIYEILQYRILI